MRKNKTKYIELQHEIRCLGNWNYKNSSSPVYTKPIAVIKLDDDEFVFRHKEILELIKIYHEVDLMSVQMIKDNKSGDVKEFETLFIDKLKYYLEILRNDLE